MNNYIFTFGSSGQIYNGGWIRIRAESLKNAQEKFVQRFKEDAYSGELLRYATSYNEDSFKKTGMLEEGNWGAFEHEFLE
ncbi:hypothetical protein [Alkalibacter mobilis]|uniref:hypothetical protein n=1 Tax=Alkalibacter mobilis TaxID=2787712 RepID=UPI00189FEE7C|nr:hypothetical protein [Alkalibacter mobilis]MBF7097605.1 hypothetical protein [Alkalibacter mobilis]